MYKLTRSIHLCLGLFSCIFLLMYGFSAFQMSHSKWFNLKPASQRSTIALSEGNDGTPRAITAELIREHGVRGELRQVNETPEGSRFRIIRPGTIYVVKYDRSTRKAEMETQVSNFVVMLNRIHHVAGLEHDYLPITLWGTLVPIISLMILGLGASGVFLWFKLYNERVTGLVLLFGSLGFALTLIIAIRLG